MNPKQKVGGSRNLTVDEKLKICKKHADCSSMSQTALAEWAKQEFSLQKPPTQGTISNILKKEKEFEALGPSCHHAKRARTVKCSELDQALAEWVLQCQARRVALSTELIKAKGAKFVELLGIENPPSFSNGWIEKFKDRYQFKGFKSHGESGSADTTAIEEALPRLQEQLSHFALKDIYNMDETGLFFRMAPDKTIAKRQIEGSKKDKSRITIAFTANADGTHKLPPFFIGHAQKPRAFNKKSGEQLGFFYRWNKKAWMTGLLFQEWLLTLDTQMKQANRHILVLMDNAPSHILGDLEVTNVKIVPLPPNTTSKIQPMDAGIISSFKRRYRRYQLQAAIDLDEQGATDIYKVDQLTAMRWCKAAWEDIPPSVVANCFRHTGLFPNPIEVLQDLDVTETTIDLDLQV
ncbi:hypothetical protein K3495_g7883, partial [Podosphaera aphanis]